MQTTDFRSLIYGIREIQEQFLVRQGKQAIRVQAIEVLLYKANQFTSQNDKLQYTTELQVRGGTEENSKIIFLISRQKHML